MKQPTVSRTPRRLQRGAALIEVLVGILIFMVGVLGLVGLQASMTRAQGSAKMRGEAMLMANEVVGTIWADRANILQYNNGDGGGCSANDRCNDWLKKVAASLPSGTAAISTTADGTVTLSVTWSTSVEGTHTYATVTTIR